MSGLTANAAAWRRRGSTERVGEHAIHVFRSEGEGPLVCLLHGYPSSSFDFAALIEHLPDINLLAFDFVGFGFSAKPGGHDYSLFEQADIAEELIARHGDGGADIVAHDMGTSVATELMAREIDGTARIEVRSALLFNGSIVIERATLTQAQRLLLSPLGPVVSRLWNRPLFRKRFAELFSDAHPLSDAEAADQWSVLSHGGGSRVAHRTIAYVGERKRYARRWHGAVSDWPGLLSLCWGLEDPVATTEVLDALRELRPAVTVVELEGIGHYPQIEVPARLAEIVRDHLGASL